MSNIQKTIKDLIYFYIRENYKKYSDENELKIIPETEIRNVIEKLYTEKKDHLRQFIKDSLKIMMKENYPGDLMVNNLTLNIFNDDELCKNRLVLEIKLYQEQQTTGDVNYSKLT